MAEQTGMSQVDVEEEYTEPKPIRDGLRTAFGETSPLQFVLIVLATVYGAINAMPTGSLAGIAGGAVGSGGIVFLLIYLYNR